MAELQRKIQEWQSKGIKESEIGAILSMTKQHYSLTIDGAEGYIPSLPYRNYLSRVLLVERVARSLSK